jgi:hypothetical protein
MRFAIKPLHVAGTLLLLVLAAAPFLDGETALPLPTQQEADAFAASVDVPASRSFHMGFTPWPYDFNAAALDYTRRTVRAHGDLVLFHLDNGVPWPEALAGAPFPAAVQNDLAELKSTLGSGLRKLYVSASPLAHDRASLALYWSTDTHQPLPASWKRKALDDPDVIRAYSNYCSRLISFFRPDYFAYAIEVNGGLSSKSPEWPKLLALVRAVYANLKAAHPGLPVFLTLQTAAFVTTWDDQWAMNKELVRSTDLVGMSTYPVHSPGRFEPGDANVDYIPADWFAQMKTLAPGLPWAITETGYIAEELRLPGTATRIRGTELWQARYADLLLRQAQAHRAEFVVWFVLRDYDKGMATLRQLGAAAEAAPVWKDMGLIDGEGRKRPALRVWDAWLRLPVVR